jgi:hypothetical protein
MEYPDHATLAESSVVHLASANTAGRRLRNALQDPRDKA